ncbi:MAG: alkaline phosphatase D family protein [Acidobacteriota bacterium]
MSRGAPSTSASSFPALDSSAALTHIGFGSCLHQDKKQPILDVVRDRDVDLFLMLGDNVYGDVSVPTEMTELRAAYAQQMRNPGFAALRRQTPMLAIWDDHDFGLNDACATFPGRAQAEVLFDRFWRIPDGAASRTRPGIYDAHVIGPPGRQVQILLLDTRFFRSNLTISADDRWRYQPDPDPSKTMLGHDQWRWLETELRKPADLRLLVSSIQVIADGHGWEAWRMLPTERDRLYNVIRRTGAAHLVILSGDRHRAGLYRRDDVIDYPLFEITSSSLNYPTTSPEEPGPHRLGPTYRQENFGTVQIDWTAGTLRLEIVDVQGKTALSQAIDVGMLRSSGVRD